MAAALSKREFRLWFDVVMHRSLEEEQSGNGLRLFRSYTFEDTQWHYDERKAAGLPENAFSIGLVEGPFTRPIAARRAA